MYNQKRLLSLQKENTKYIFSVNLDWLKDQYNIFTENELETKLQDKPAPSISEIFDKAQENPGASQFYLLETQTKNCSKSILPHDNLGEAIRLEWDVLDELFTKWCKENKLAFLYLEKSEQDISLYIQNDENTSDILDAILKKYNSEQQEETYSYMSYMQDEIIAIDEETTQKILTQLIKKELRQTFEGIYAFYDYVLLTEK